MRKVLMIVILAFVLVLSSCNEIDNSQYTLEYVDYNESIIQTGSFENGSDLSSVSAPTVPTREGYTFDGWDVEVPSTMGSNDIVITATYTINQNAIDYIDYDGTIVQTESFDYDSDLSNASTPTEPSREGYTFDGWDGEVPSTMPAEDLTFQATYTINQYTIEYIDYDGTILQTESIDYNSDLSSVSEPSREGYTFDGWDGEVLSTMPAEDLSYQATYTINQYTIEYIDYDGTILQTESFDYDSDLSSVSSPTAPSREGYIFDGWDGEVPSKMGANDIVITATHTIMQYTLSFDTDQGSDVAAIYQDYGSAVVAPLDPEKENCTFLGWYTDSSFEETYTFTTMPSFNITLYARWSISIVFFNDVNSYLEELGFNGAILIYEDGETLLSEGYGWADVAYSRENTPETRFMIGSITKQFTAVAIMMLYEDGLLSVDDTVDMYIPDFPNGDIITIHHLLTHTSGLENYLIHIPLSDEEYLRSYHSPLSLINIIRGYSLEFTPGEEFEYSNTNYIMLGHIIEVITGVTYQEFMQQNIFIPLEMNNTGYGGFEFPPGPKDARGYNNIINAESTPAVFKHSSISYSSGSMVSTTGDLLIWHHALMNHILISEATTDLIYTPYAEYYSELGFDGYGYGWHIMLVPNGEPRVFHSGNALQFLTYFYRNTGSDLAIIFITNEQSGAGLMDPILFYIFEQLAIYGY